MGISEDLEDLARSVEVMRRLGVVEWHNIKLGPAPQAPPQQSFSAPLTEESRQRERLRRLLQSSGVAVSDDLVAMLKGAL